MEVTNVSRVVEGCCLLAERPVRVLERPGGDRIDPEERRRGPPLGRQTTAWKRQGCHETNERKKE